MLQRDRMPPAERVAVLVFIVMTELMFGASGAGSAALDAWSTGATTLSPEPVPGMDRGGVLIVLGRTEEAYAILTEALKSGLDSGNAVVCRGLLARAARELVDEESARRWAEQVGASLATALFAALLKAMLERAVSNQTEPVPTGRRPDIGLILLPSHPERAEALESRQGGENRSPPITLSPRAARATRRWGKRTRCDHYLSSIHLPFRTNHLADGGAGTAL
jgi:hypothetical protein